MSGRPHTMRVRAEDSDSDNEGDTQTTNYAREEGLRRLQEIDLGTIRAGLIKQDDRKQKYEDRANVKLLLESRDACKAGTEANALYNKNKSAIAAWNNPNNVVDNHEENFDPLQNGQSHRQRMRNQYGGRVEEPNDFEAGYTTGGRGGLASRGGRGGMTAPAAPRAPAPAAQRAPAPTAPRAGIAPRPGQRTSRPAPTHPVNYRPLDPAIDPDNDPRSKYARTSSRGGTPVGRGGGNAGRSSGRADFNARVAPAPAPARVSRPDNADRQHRVDILADPATFMRAVDEMKAKSAKTKTETNKPATVKASTKTSRVTIDSQWADIGPAVPAATPEHVTRTSLRPEAAGANANIRQVPTSEFALPHPHRGDTESWTDGHPSARLSDFSSPAVSSQPSNQSTGPSALAQGNAIGLGIRGFAKSMNDDETSNNHNTADEVNLLDVTEDLRELQEPPKPRAVLAKRIIVDGHVYLLDESALGNASVEVTNATPAPPPESARIVVDQTPSTSNTIADKKPARVTSNTGNRNAAAQTTPSLADSRWAAPAPTRAMNPFVDEIAPARATQSQVQSPSEFIAFVGRRSEEGVSAFLETELTSAGGESITSTPNFSFSNPNWGRSDTKVTTNSGTQVQSPSTASNTPSTTQANVDRNFTADGAPINPGRTCQPPIIDKHDLVRLQAVGNASFGMTPFRPTSGPSSKSTTPKVSAQPTPQNLSSATSVKSDATAGGARGRDLAASIYAPLDQTSASVADALGTLSLNTLGRPRGGNATLKPPAVEAGHSTQLANTARRGAHDENTNPRHASVTSRSGGRPVARASSQVPAAPYMPISSTRRPAGVGFDILQADIAAANAHLGISSQDDVQDDGYESEL